MKTNNGEGCHFDLQPYEMTHQIKYHIFKKTAEIVWHTNIIISILQKSIINLFTCYKPEELYLLLLFIIINITHVLKTAATMVY